MGMGGRLGDGGIEDPEIRPESIDNPEIRPDSVDNPEIRPESVGNPDIRPEPMDNPDLRSPTIDNPDIAPQPMVGGIPLVPLAVIGGLVVVAIAAFSIFGGGGRPAASSGASLAPDATTAPAGAASDSPGSPGASVAGGGGTAAGPGTANLTVTGADVSGSWTLEGGTDVSPTTTLIAAVWTEVASDSAGGFADLIVLSMSGPIADGTQSTDAAGLILGLSITRTDDQGTDLFNHLFTSNAGECQVTMQRTGDGVSGTFTCTGIRDADGHTSDVTGSFAT